LGIIPTSELIIEGMVIKLKTLRFGVFQPLVTTVEITTRIEQPTAKPIVTIKDTPVPVVPNPQPTTPTTPEGDKIAPTLVKIDGPDDSVPGIEKSQAYRFVFTEKIAAASVVVSGTMKGNTNPQVQISKTTVDGDTVTVTPVAAGWSLGGGKELIVTVKDAAGNALATPATVKKEVVEKIYYVHPTGEYVEDGGTGTIDNPMYSINEAIQAGMEADKDFFVYVAKGTYEDSVTFYVGSRLYGGFPDDEKWVTRSAKANPTIIPYYVGGSTWSPSIANQKTGIRVLVDYAVLNGFEMAYSGSGTIDGLSISAEGGTWYIENNNIRPEAGTDVQGISFTGGGLATLIARGNRVAPVLTEVAEGSCTAFYVYDSVDSVIENNIIQCSDTGLGFNNKGLVISDPIGLTKVHNNVINSGTVTDGGSLGLEIKSYDATPLNIEVRNNTIWAKTESSGNSAEGVNVDIDGTNHSMKFDNNSITAIAPSMGTAIGIEVSDSNSRRLFDGPLDIVTSIRNNAFNVSAIDGTQYIANEFETVAALNDDSGTGLTRSGNISAPTMGFVNESERDFKITANSVLKGVGVNGKGAGWSFEKDLAGTSRGTLWSIGAYQ